MEPCHDPNASPETRDFEERDRQALTTKALLERVEGTSTDDGLRSGEPLSAGFSTLTPCGQHTLAGTGVEMETITGWERTLLGNPSAPNGGKLILQSDLILSQAVRRFEDVASQYEGGRGIPVGAEGINERICADAVREFRDRLNKGDSIGNALAFAKNWARGAVVKHNEKRRKDVCWQRTETLADDKLDRVAFRLLDQFKEQPTTPSGSGVLE